MEMSQLASKRSEYEFFSSETINGLLYEEPVSPVSVESMAGACLVTRTEKLK